MTMKLLLDRPHGTPALLVVSTKESRRLAGAVNVRLTAPNVTLTSGGRTATGDAPVVQFALGMN